VKVAAWVSCFSFPNSWDFHHQYPFSAVWLNGSCFIGRGLIHQTPTTISNRRMVVNDNNSVQMIKHNHKFIQRKVVEFLLDFLPHKVDNFAKW